MVKNQHYVPRFYLRGFVSQKQKIWCFDKVSGKSFQSSILNLANENYFYDFDENDREQLVEKHLGEIETRFAPHLARLLKSLHEQKFSFLDPVVRSEICMYMVYQILRTREYRQEMSQMFEQMTQGILDKGWMDIHEIKQRGIYTSPSNIKNMQSRSILGLDKRSIKEELYQVLNSHIWIIFENRTDQFLYCSDHPVVKVPHLHSPYYSMSGYQSQGIEINFPLSPFYCLGLFDRSQFFQYEKSENSLLPLENPDNIIYFNALQVKNSYRQVYSYSEDFDIAQLVLKNQPFYADTLRKRVEAG